MSNTKKNLVVIPLRGNSKRLPNKNILDLGGLPLFMHSVIYARNNSNVVHELVVSTDDTQIKEIALKNNVRVLDRPSYLAEDHVPTINVLKDVICSIDEKYDNIILLQAPNPLRPANLLVDALQIFNKGNYDSLMTVSRNNQKFGKIVNNNFEPYNYKFGQRSQDLDPLYFENGLLYIAKSSLIREGILLGEKNYPYIVNHPVTSIDIDTQVEFDLAEYFYKKYKNDL